MIQKHAGKTDLISIIDFRNESLKKKIRVLTGCVLYFVESINQISYYPNLLIAGNFRICPRFKKSDLKYLTLNYTE